MITVEMTQARLERARAQWGDAIRGRMFVERAKDNSDEEIVRSLQECVCGDRLIAVAQYMRSVGDNLVDLTHPAVSKP